MFCCIKLRLKLVLLRNRVRSLEYDIIVYKYDARIKNELYYCGRGDLDGYVDSYCNYLYFRIAACRRLINRYSGRLLVCGGFKILGKFSADAKKIFKF